ncbi:hypothetical protein LCGC14_1801430, partial [marine sediment metagenome]
MPILAVTMQPATMPAEPPIDTSLLARTYLGNSVGQWAALLGVLLATFIVAKIVSFSLSHQGRRFAKGGRLSALGMILTGLAGPAAMLIFAGGLYLGGMQLELKFTESLDATDFWPRCCQALAALAAGWAMYRLVDVLEVFLTRLTSRTRTQLDDQLVPLVRKALRLFTVIVVGLFIAQNIFEWKVGSLLAGLGLGGLAFALAAQDTLKNLFGSITIFGDRPFQMGDRIKIGDVVGNVEEVGFRSTRIRTLTGHLVTIPNAVVVDSPVENIGRRPYIKRVLDVTVTYDTHPDKVRRAVEIIREMFDARMDHFHEDSPPRVYFNDFNDVSLNIVVYYWFVPPDWWEYLAFTHDFNMELLRRFNDEGIEFAFPTQTLYVKK